MSTFYNRQFGACRPTERAAQARARKMEAARHHAWFLHTQMGLPYTEACNKAGYDPTEHGRFVLLVGAGMGAVFGLVALVLWVLQ
jgi:hypothetical protein